MMWGEPLIVMLLSFSKFHIDTVLKYQNSADWHFTGFYGHPNRSCRLDSWRLLRQLHASNDLPWLCAGDFNELLIVFDKQG